VQPKPQELLLVSLSRDLGMSRKAHSVLFHNVRGELQWIAHPFETRASRPCAVLLLCRKSYP
jgi:hypothetical protein